MASAVDAIEGAKEDQSELKHERQGYFSTDLQRVVEAETVRWRLINETEETLSTPLAQGKDAIIRRCLPVGWLGFDKQVI